jgi:hypothetical protein
MRHCRRSTVLFKATAFLLPMMVVSGCAVLKVDVDVYKGALANQHDVQTKQLCAMTMAAKPILLSLSNTLFAAETKDTKAQQQNPQFLATVTTILRLYKDTGTNAKVGNLRQVYYGVTNAARGFVTNTNPEMLQELHTNLTAFTQATYMGPLLLLWKYRLRFLLTMRFGLSLLRI